ncbi:MAG TPA: hypothetical protein H9805_12735 [Candidatus Janibacter merdipullorum]|nr:hypothetical protein [Candidatus Janibacter merdipullorum]
MPSSTWDDRAEAPIERADSFADAPLPASGGRQRTILTSADDPRLDLDTLLLRRDHPDLVVVLHGALVRKDVTLPRFEWLRSLRERPENLLFVSDPSLAWDEYVPLAWYVGPEEHDTTTHIAAEVAHLAARLGTTRTAFTGSSGGGYASLALAARTPGSLAVSFSPQTRISAYDRMPVKSFRTRLFPGHRDMESVESAHRDRVDQTHRWAAGEHQPDAFVRIAHNAKDHGHIEAHLRPFLRAAGVDEETFEGHPRISVVLDDFGEGHTPPRPTQMREHLDLALAWHAEVR